MRSIPDIERDIAEVQAEIQSIRTKERLLQDELESVQERDELLTAVQGIGEIGPKLTKARWKTSPDRRVYIGYSLHTFKHAYTLEVRSDTYQKNIYGSKDYTQVYIELFTDDEKQWKMLYWIRAKGRYSNSKPRLFVADLEGAQKMTLKEIEKKLISVRKNLMKKIEAHES